MPATLSRRAFLGAELPGDADAFSDDGMLVAGVQHGSMVERAGIGAGDTIHAIAGVPLRSLAELAAALRRAGASATTTIEATVGDGTYHVEVGVETLPLEPGVIYGELDAGDVLLRTLSTRADEPRALIAFIQGIACESIDQPLAPDAPLPGLVDGWTRAGYDTLRFDKRGVGDSEGGPCGQTDFATELADARAFASYAAAEARARRLPLVVVGHSVGGIIAAQLAPSVAPAAIIVYGTPVMRWLACLQDSARRQLALHGASDDEIRDRVAALARLADTGDLNGRSAAYHRGLDALDLEAGWRAVTAPVLVVRGEYDWVVADDDQARIATLAAGPTTIVDVAGLDHLFAYHVDRDASLRDYGSGTFDPALVTATVAWLAAHV